MSQSQEFRHIVRIVGSDAAGTLKIAYALTEVKGIGLNLSNAILKKAGVNPDTRVGFVTEGEISRIEDVIKDPVKFGLPVWLMNRRKDAETA